MALFLSTFINKIDRKGRVSVPITFRNVLVGQSFHGIVVFPSFRDDYSAIEACGMDRMDRLSASLDKMNPFSDEREGFASTIFNKSAQLPFDGEGRIIVPDALREHAGLTDLAAFAGQGATFQIWQPEALRKFQEMAERRSRETRATLRLVPLEDEEPGNEP